METSNRMADEAVGEVARVWWWFLVTGVLWVLIAILVLRFNLTSIAAVGALLGAIFLLAGVNEFFTMAMRDVGWRWLHAVMGVLFIIGGIWAFVHPIGAFYELASVLGFLIVLKGTLDIGVAVATKDQNDIWGLGLLIGLLELALGFWASQQFFAPRAILIITWVGFAALFRGVGEIVMAFHLRGIAKTVGP
jgi:uncharacterized membrane protein HdeD (DUF308 family)